MIKGFNVVFSKQSKKTNKVETIHLGLSKNFNTVKECYYMAWKMLDMISDIGEELTWAYLGGNLLYEGVSDKERVRKENIFSHETEEFIYKIKIQCYN